MWRTASYASYPGYELLLSARAKGRRTEGPAAGTIWVKTEDVLIGYDEEDAAEELLPDELACCDLCIFGDGSAVNAFMVRFDVS
jgi:hypothetical protein